MGSLVVRAMRVALAAAALAACAPTLDWREVRPPGSGALLLFPCRPKLQERDVALAGPAVRLGVHACSAGGVTWGLALADVVDPARTGPALRALRAAAERNLGAPSTTGVPLAIPGATPNEASGRSRLDGRRPDGAPVQMEVAVFTRGTLVFQASVLGEKLQPDAVQTFFSAIRLDR